MKTLLVSLLMIVGFGITARAAENPMPLFPTQVQTESNMSLEDQDANIESMSRYCCVPRGGTYCDMGHYEQFGAPCSCSVGNNDYAGHVCRD